VDRLADDDSASGETLVIDGRVTVKVVKVVGDQVKVGIEAPREIDVYREELLTESPRAAEARSPEGERPH